VTKKKSAPRNPQLTPNQFLRARRPEKFSDSIVGDEPILDRSQLEFHLETLTSRNQEVAFATFARHLAEKEICPNLLPQTGPTGGGDSKVDSESYPVADQLALGWYVGIGREAASERWALAFSAKKAWKPKAISDIDKALETGRSYSKVFFISNQYIRDQERAAVEDKLRKKHGVDVRILDRTWILDKVFGNRHEALAIQDLQLTTSRKREITKGPLDTQREIDLRAVETRIQNALQEGRRGVSLAQDSIESANLARQLERPRTEIDGLYERAEQITSDCGTRYELLKCAYERARTAFWWYEDYERFSELYGSVEERARGSLNAYDLELLSNLWQLLHSAVATGKLTPERSNVSKRTDLLFGELERLRQQDEQPSGALHAKTLGLLMNFSISLSSGKSISPMLLEFQEVVRSCEGLVGFPLEPIIAFLIELGESFGGIPAYDELFDTIIDVKAGREGELAAARLLLRRGVQQLKDDHPYEAIRTLGLSLRRLYKHESRSDAIRALYYCGCAYEQVGLLWAARGTLLSAASLAAGEWAKYGEITPSQAACYRKIKWLELQLGRVPQALAWHEVDTIVRQVLNDKRGLESTYSEEDGVFDAILGILFLKTDYWELKWLSSLPDVLDQLGLFNAWAALMYALGHESELRETFFQVIGAGEDPKTLFAKWRDQPASKNLPKHPSLYEERKVILESHLLGCNITVKSDNVSPCVELAESVLAALESLLSTGTVKSLTIREPVLSMDVRMSDFAQPPFEFKLQDDTGRPHVNITCARIEPQSMSSSEQENLKQTLLRLLGAIFARIVMADDVIHAFEVLVRDELALERSVGFTGSFVTVSNVLGAHPKSRISDWSKPGARTFALDRTTSWDADVIDTEDLKPKKARPLKTGTGEPPAEMLDRSNVTQDQLRTVSLIRESLWKRAKWSGMTFSVHPKNAEPPAMGLMFANAEAARDIFRFLAEEIGQRDTKNLLRVAIIRGINEANPHWYKVVIGSNYDAELREKGVKYAAFVSRIHEIHPDSGINLERFLSSYESVGNYILTGAGMKNGAVVPENINCPFILKTELHVKQAWQIGRHDPDCVAIQSDDNVIIPADEKNAPVLELLRWKRERHDVDVKGKKNRP
jgi:hypothetical protein